MQPHQFLYVSAATFAEALNAINKELNSETIQKLNAKLQNILVFQEVTPNHLDPKNLKIQLHMVAILVADPGADAIENIWNTVQQVLPLLPGVNLDAVTGKSESNEH